MDIVNPQVETYMRGLLERSDDPALLEMEADAEASGFPIVGRLVGVTLEVLARSIGARRIFELGSGYGYSAYWFARAVGADGEVHCTDDDPGNERRAAAYLGRAGLWGCVRYQVGDALQILRSVPGEFDVVFCDIAKDAYPQAWELARDRIRVGGLYVADNVIRSSGMWVPDPKAEGRTANAEAVDRHNRLIAADDRYVSMIVPTRDGVMAALRIA
jgi:predicted O-methyltransferase YrrM